MDFNVATYKSIRFAGAIIGMCQSVIWLVLTICAILTFRCVLRTPQYDSDHFILTTIVKLYFEGYDCRVEENPDGYPDISEAKLTKPVEVFSWMIAFLAISSVQFLSSLFLIKRRNAETSRYILRDWCFITFLVAVMDAALTGIFIGDTIRLQEFLRTEKKEDEDHIVTAPTVMFIIAARGFALWMINIAFLLYFGIWLSCSSSNKRESSGKEPKAKAEQYIGHENLVFNASSESLAVRDYGRSDLVSFDSVREMNFHAKKHHRRSISVSSFEAVTPFNEEEYQYNDDKNHIKHMKDSERFICDCQKWSDRERIFSGSRGMDTIYHSHACPALRMELEEKLATVKGKEDRIGQRTKKLKDFSHDIRNFKPGGGQNQAKSAQQHGRIPVAPPLPAATTCNNSSFY